MATQVSEKMTRQQAADYLGVKICTLAQDVVTNRHKFPYLKIGSKVVYDRAALDRWVAAHSVNPVASV